MFEVRFLRQIAFEGLGFLGKAESANILHTSHELKVRGNEFYTDNKPETHSLLTRRHIMTFLPLK